MIVYLALLAAVVLIAYVAEHRTLRAASPSLDEDRGRRHRLATLLVVALLTAVAGLRMFVGTDYADYRGLFSIFQGLRFSTILDPVVTFDVDRTFVLTTRLIGFLGSDPQWSFFVYSLFTVAVMVTSLRRYSSDFVLSLFLYVASTIYFSAFNGIRQWIAAAILFWGARFLFERRIVPYLLCVGVADLFHPSALLLVLAVIFLYSSRWGILRVAMIVAFVLAAAFFSQSVHLTSDFLSVDSRYQTQIVLNPKDDGINFLRAIVEALPAVLALSLKDIRNRTDAKTLVIVNMSLLNALFALLALQMTVLARAFFYFAPFNLLLIPILLESAPPRHRKALTAAVVVAYLAFMVLVVPRDSDLLPYRSLLAMR